MAATVACHGADGGVPPVVAGCQAEPDVPACATAAAEVDATRAAILAAVAASRKAHAEAARAAAIEAKPKYALRIQRRNRCRQSRMRS